MGVWVSEKKGFKTQKEAIEFLNKEIHPKGCRCNDHNAHRLEHGGYRKEKDGTYTACIVVHD